MPEKPYKVIVMREEDWVAFRWSIALDVVAQMTDIETARASITTLRAADAKVTVEWRGEL